MERWQENGNDGMDDVHVRVLQRLLEIKAGIREKLQLIAITRDIPVLATFDRGHSKSRSIATSGRSAGGML